MLKFEEAGGHGIEGCVVGGEETDVAFEHGVEG